MYRISLIIAIGDYFFFCIKRELLFEGRWEFKGGKIILNISIKGRRLFKIGDYYSRKYGTSLTKKGFYQILVKSFYTILLYIISVLNSHWSKPVNFLPGWAVCCNMPTLLQNWSASYNTRGTCLRHTIQSKIKGLIQKHTQGNNGNWGTRGTGKQGNKRNRRKGEQAEQQEQGNKKNRGTRRIGEQGKKRNRGNMGTMGEILWNEVFMVRNTLKNGQSWCSAVICRKWRAFVMQFHLIVVSILKCIWKTMEIAQADCWK